MSKLFRHFTMPMKIEGQKVVLKPMQKQDLPTFVLWFQDEDIKRFTIMRSPTLEEELKWYDQIQANPNEEVFSVFLKEANKLIGNCAYHFNQKREDEFTGECFLGLAIGEKAEWGRGYGTDALTTLVNFLYHKFKVDSIYLTVDTLNKAAQCCYEKCGFKVVKKQAVPERVNSNGEQYVMRWSA